MWRAILHHDHQLAYRYIGNRIYPSVRFVNFIVMRSMHTGTSQLPPTQRSYLLLVPAMADDNQRRQRLLLSALELALEEMRANENREAFKAEVLKEKKREAERERDLLFEFCDSYDKFGDMCSCHTRGLASTTPPAAMANKSEKSKKDTNAAGSHRGTQFRAMISPDP